MLKGCTEGGFGLPVLRHVPWYVPRHLLKYMLKIVPEFVLEPVPKHVLRHLPDKHVLEPKHVLRLMSHIVSMT